MRTPEQLIRHAEAQKRYRASHPDLPNPPYVREQHREAMRRYRQRHPDRYNAHMTVYRAIRDGRLVKVPCNCGEPKVEAHHYLGYAKEHQLTVEWLCRPCHQQAHQ